MTLYALPKRYSPDFSNPRVKPRGEVRLIKGHPLAKNIRLFVIFDGKGAPLDLVTGKRLTLVNNPTYSADIRGKQLEFDGVNQTALMALDLSNTNSVTVLTGHSWDAYSTNDDFLYEYTATANSNNGFNVDPNAAGGAGNRYNLVNNNSSGSSVSATSMPRPSVGYHNYIYRHAGTSGGLTGWVDGVEQSMTILIDPGNTANFDNSTLFIASRNASALFGDVDYNYLILFDDDITDKNGSIQAHELTKNPWQILEPKTPSLYFTPGGVVSGFQAAWATSANVLLN